MKGNISLKDFVNEVRNELLLSIDDKTPFFVLNEVELEVSFGLDLEGKAGANLVVVDLGGSTKATQTHKVKLKLTPFIEDIPPLGDSPNGEISNKEGESNFNATWVKDKKLEAYQHKVKMLKAMLAAERSDKIKAETRSGGVGKVETKNKAKAKSKAKSV